MISDNQSLDDPTTLDTLSELAMIKAILSWFTACRVNYLLMQFSIIKVAQ